MHSVPQREVLSATIGSWFDDLPQLGFTARPDGFVDHCNRRFREHTGAPSEAMLGSGWQELLAREEAPRIAAAFDRAIRTQAPFEETLRMRGRDGDYRWFLARITPSFDDDLRLQRWIGTFTDVDALLAEAMRASHAKDEFLAMLGHELRNPLAPIMTGLQLLRLKGDLAASRELQAMERQANHLVRLVDDLLDVSRIGAGKISLHKEPIELARVTTIALEMARPLLEKRAHQLRVSVPSEGLLVDVDPVRMSQVFANLLTNAAKFTPAGGHVTLAATLRAGYVEATVSDDGIGLGPESLTRIFEPFVQARQTLEKSHGGLGLGLAIVKSLTTLHAGSVSAHSAGLGQGSTFVVRLPQLQAPSAAAQADR
jgi:PAS domain S-box-containing protein